MARLILATAEGQQAIELRPINSLGRHPNNSIQLLDKIVSKEHCILEQRDGQFVLRDLGSVIDHERPTEVAVEKVFVNVNPQSTLLLGQARGAAICAAVLAGVPVAEYTALQVKQAVVGAGKAGKEQVQMMVRRLLSLPGDPSPDAADALACAICHAHGGALAGMSTRGYRVKGGRLVK